MLNDLSVIVFFQTIQTKKNNFNVMFTLESKNYKTQNLTSVRKQSIKSINFDIFESLHNFIMIFKGTIL